MPKIVTSKGLSTTSTEGETVLFETCELYNLRVDGVGVIVAPAHKEGTRYGYVFESCTIDGVVDNKDALGRPWHNSPIAVYLNTTMKRLPSATGWNNMGTIPALFARIQQHGCRRQPHRPE